VRGANDIAVEIAAQDFRVLSLDACRHGLADKGKGLVSIEAAQLQDLAIEREALIGEDGFTKSDATCVLVEHVPGL
jgi:hypothetical protein